MLKERRLWLLLALLAGDTLAAVGALLAAYALRFSLGLFPVPLGVPPLEPYLFLLLPLLPLHALALGAAGLYRYRRERTKADEAFALVRGVTLAAILLVAATFFIRGFSYSRGVIVLFWGLDLLLVFWERLAIREALRYLRRHGRFVRRVLIAGAGPLGQAVAHRLRGHPELGLRVVGFLDDRRPVGERVEGREVLGGFEAVQEVLAHQAADQLFIALPLEAHAEMLKILNALEGELVDVKVIPDILQFITLKAAVEELDGLPIISLSEGPVTGLNRVAKRALDLAASALALV
ncbi:MAG: undecaprenyl-phosphate glucose phosphotransferase, partial [Candidatus Rokubacteria bacterium]|nr:undecaprenyl-phosphate glucose phosphotransferase [Candidatus Rokubacteria bacterium]